MQKDVKTFTDKDIIGFTQAAKDYGYTEEALTYPDGVLLRKPGSNYNILVYENSIGESFAIWYWAEDMEWNEWTEECDEANSIMPFVNMDIDDERFFDPVPTDEIAIIDGLGPVHVWEKALEITQKAWERLRRGGNS